MMSPNLPELCYAFLPTDGGKIVIVMRGERGYRPTNWDSGFKEEDAITLNQRMGVTVPQMKAMLAGSMFGWHTRGADPAIYAPDYAATKTPQGT